MTIADRAAPMTIADRAAPMTIADRAALRDAAPALRDLTFSIYALAD